MCGYDRPKRTVVEQAVDLFMKKGQPFTGWDIHRHILKDGQNGEGWLARETSGLVREMFNLGRIPGWASTQVVPGTGPVLYFRVTPHMTAFRVSKQIRESLVP